MKQRDELIGALVGLANTATGNSYKADSETDKVMLSALRLVPTGTEDELIQAAERVRAEKVRLAPDCAVCKNPCGRNADLDMAEFYADPQDVLSLKALLLSAVCALADAGCTDCMPLVYQSVRALGDVWTAEKLTPLVLEAGSAWARRMAR